MKYFFTAIFLLSSIVFGQTVFVNELHYDNTGTDSREGVEIAGPAGTDLAGWIVYLYNGNDNSVYDNIALSGLIDDEGNGYGALWFEVASNFIQNGAPDGFALVDNQGAVVLFLSYEGTITAVDGPATGMTSVDIGVEQAGNPDTQTLQLKGTGLDYSHFFWAGPDSSSRDSINFDQFFGAPVIAPEPSNHVTGFATSNVKAASVQLSWTGATGAQVPDNYLLLGRTDAGSYASVKDSVPVVDDQDWSDGAFALNLSHNDGADGALIENLISETNYHFSIYPYTNRLENINFKTDGTVPEVSVTTTAALDTVIYGGFETGADGFTSYNVLGDQVWGPSSYGGDYFMKMSGYSDAAYDNEDWLFTPAMNLNNSSDEILSFRSARNYGSPGDNSMLILVSTDYDGVGNPHDFTWTDISLQCTISSGNWVFTASGDVDLSSFSGKKVFVAWKYTSTTASAATWEITDVLITGNITDKAPNLDFNSILQTPAVPNGGEDLTVSVDVTDDNQAGLMVYLNYWYNDNEPEQVLMDASGTNYSHTFSGSMLNDGDILGYMIWAIDSGENEAGPSYMRGFFVGGGDIGDIRQVNSDGVSDFERFTVRLRGQLSTPLDYLGPQPVNSSMQVSSDQGIALVSFDSTYDAQPGDSIEVIGEIGQYNGLMQVEINSLSVLKTGNDKIVPTKLRLAEFIGDFDASEYYEGSLVQVDGLTMSDASAWGSSSQNFIVSDDAGTTELTMRIGENMGIWEQYPSAPTDPLNVIGILGQYDFSSPFTEGYQLLPVEISTGTGIGNENLPGQFDLGQNYPNPFNPSTTVSFTLPAAEKVSFTVYNAVGQRVYREVNKYNAGLNKINFKADGLSSGIYFYQIEAGNYKAVKKMILMR